MHTNPSTPGEIGVPVHLVVGYELLLDLAIFGVLMWLVRGVVLRGGGLTSAWSPRYPRDGMLFWRYLALYSAGRFVVEFYREEPSLGWDQPVTPSRRTLDAMVP